MAFGFPARFARSHSYRLGEAELLEVAKAALTNLDWPYEVRSGTEVRARPARDARSWGEEMRVAILPGGVMRAESRCAGVRFQIFDFGKNRSNVDAFFARVDALIGL